MKYKYQSKNIKSQLLKHKDEKQLPKQKAKSKHPGKSKNENIKKGLF